MQRKHIIYLLGFLAVIIIGVCGYIFCTGPILWLQPATTPAQFIYTGNITVEVREIKAAYKPGEVQFRGYVMEVSDPRSVKVMLPTKGTGFLQKTSVMSKEAGAIAAVDGGGFFNQPAPDKPPFYPLYYTVQSGRLISHVQRYQNEMLIGITEEGILTGGIYDDSDAVMQAGIVEGVSFGPRLIKDGQRLHVPGGNAEPRTAIGQKKDGTILFLVIDGRAPDWSLGATYYDLQETLLKLGAYNAFNLDGGGSATMVYDNKVINKPSDLLGEREVATGWAIVDDHQSSVPDDTRQVPDLPVTRIEFLLGLGAITGLEQERGPVEYKDIHMDSNISPYIYPMLENGWIFGYPDQTLRLYEFITVNEAEIITARALGNPPPHYNRQSPYLLKKQMDGMFMELEPLGAGEVSAPD